MSFLRACSEALSKPALLRPLLSLRALSKGATPPAPTATKEPSEIAPIPQKDVLSADIISGAPGIAHTHPQGVSEYLTSLRVISS
jgi:NADH dehydrogenase (ubiquinone) Fe-S protein 4